MSAQSDILKNYQPKNPIGVQDANTRRYLEKELVAKLVAIIQLQNQVIAEIDPSNQVYTVATLPTNPFQGQSAFVSNATSPTLNSTVVGGGSVFTRVHWSGSAWQVG